jgi:hypothetical protein
MADYLRGFGATDVSLRTHTRPIRRRRQCARWPNGGEEGGVVDFGAFKRPAPAVWGNGLWGSVGWGRAIL